MPGLCACSCTYVVTSGRLESTAVLPEGNYPTLNDPVHLCLSSTHIAIHVRCLDLGEAKSVLVYVLS